MRATALLSGFLAVCASAATTLAQAARDEVGCPAVRLSASIPARSEWVYWTSLGFRPTSRLWVPGIGAELTWELLEYQGFPADDGLGWPAEVRAGPWAAGSLRGTDGLVEGGVKLHTGGVRHASWGTFDLRTGLGYGPSAAGPISWLNATVLYGIRAVLRRHYQYDECQGRPSASDLDEANVARLFLTFRRPLTRELGYEWVIGIELSPTFLLPPYSLSRAFGGPLRQ
jgi:hypothetical protein